ncbi:3-hydroxyacyl-CoA dehydrogenase family protein [Streptomyces sp. NPDC046931]|uniref:3-hydroxyacyl-CoA dehydrogenase family protein n=1 Tax=Streptomyces sp. NPDC046931 TaxID=3154806 RepID=UPI0034088C33
MSALLRRPANVRSGSHRQPPLRLWSRGCPRFPDQPRRPRTATEAFAPLKESVADPAGIGRIARDVLGLRMGPFELMDLTGLNVAVRSHRLDLTRRPLLRPNPGFLPDTRPGGRRAVRPQDLTRLWSYTPDAAPWAEHPITGKPTDRSSHR